MVQRFELGYIHVSRLPFQYHSCCSRSDVPTKMFIMNLDSKKKCVISDLDATHVFVKADSLPEIRKELEELHDRNVYVRPR
ncbi:unnamed protein product [Discosporangium mesarthrocarpum]